MKIEQKKIRCFLFNFFIASFVCNQLICYSIYFFFRSTTSALCVFTESIQKLADLATHTKGYLWLIFNLANYCLENWARVG